MTGLFQRTPLEAYEHLSKVLATERLVRKRMRELNPDEFSYWKGQIDVIDEALESLEALRPRGGSRKERGLWAS